MRRHRSCSRATRHAATPSNIAANAAVRRWCTRTSSAPTRTRFPTTRSSTNLPPSANEEAHRDPISQISAVPRARRHSRPASRSKHRSRSGQEVHDATRPGAGRRRTGHRFDSRLHLYSPRRGSHVGCVRTAAAIPRRAEDHGGHDQRHACAKRCGATSASSSSAKTWPTPAAKRICKQVKGKGGVFKAHRRPAARIRRRARLQFAPRRSRHRRPRHRHGHARAEACRGDSVLRLHLARHDADSR